MAIPAMDFKTLQVLAVTRCASDRLESRVVYRDDTGKTRDLWFKCSNEEHDKFAVEFKNYLIANSEEDI